MDMNTVFGTMLCSLSDEQLEFFQLRLVEEQNRRNKEKNSFMTAEEIVMAKTDRIAAIKMVRNRTGMLLSESKNLIDKTVPWRR